MGNIALAKKAFRIIHRLMTAASDDESEGGEGSNEEDASPELPDSDDEAKSPDDSNKEEEDQELQKRLQFIQDTVSKTCRKHNWSAQK